MMRVIQRRSAQIIHLLYLVVQIFLTYKRRLNILHDTKRKFLSINYYDARGGMTEARIRYPESHGVILTGSRLRATECEIWGILNITPDSFSDGGLYLTEEAAVHRARQMIEQGAEVIDVGGESSRPAGATYGSGAIRVDIEEESRRVVPVIRSLKAQGATISIDTVKSDVARSAIQAGATIVNDVSCGASGELLDVVANAGVELVLMHTRGQGQVSGRNVRYGDVVKEVVEELLSASERALSAGITRDKIWIDPGIGFAKNAGQSLVLLARIHELVATGYRVLVGPSRKSFIAEAAPDASGAKPSPSERIGGTAAAVTAAVLGGVQAVRVHDVALMRQAVLVGRRIRSARSGELAQSTQQEEPA